MNETRLTATQLETFNLDGALRLPSLIPRADALAMGERLWTDLADRYGIARHDPSTWAVERPASFQRLERAGAFAGLDQPAFRALFDEFLGVGHWDAPRWWGQALVTFPDHSRPWDVPHKLWHMDLPVAVPAPNLACLRVFTFIGEVRAMGGGTLYIEGSHRVVMDCGAGLALGEGRRSADMRERLKAEEPWLGALWSPGGADRVGRFMTDGATVRGVPLKGKEMTGEPGDSIVMHPNMFHTVAPNALDQPRLMLVQAIYRRGVAEA
jgi:hypothetical protein